jgi:uncharacterized protein (TIGR01777 family)
MPRILISGASGLIGSALAPFLHSHGYEVLRLVRREARAPDEVQWDPKSSISPQLVSGFEAVIHLSGESVAGRWNTAKKRRIRDSRVVSTRNLSQALTGAETKPAVFVCASAIGFYGSRADEILSEASPPGAGFLAEVSQEWEGATKPASDAGIRVVNLRTGIVLARNGGALKAMLLPFRFGLGGRIASGRQWWSWIHIEDLVSAVAHIIREQSPRGPVNLTAPNPVTNAEFTRALASALHRPAIINAPAFAVRLAFGEFADEGVLASARVLPKKLIDAGFKFRFTGLDDALSSLVES